MKVIECLALIYVSKNAEKGQPASELGRMFIEAKEELQNELRKLNNANKTE